MHFLESFCKALAWCGQLNTAIRSGTGERCRGLCVVHWPMPVAARCKAWVCGLSLAGIAGSNPAGGMGICVL